jgi:hypothetical protein
MKNDIYMIDKEPFEEWYALHKDSMNIAIKGSIELETTDFSQYEPLFEKCGRTIDISKLNIYHDWWTIPNSGRGAYTEIMTDYADNGEFDDGMPILLKLYANKKWEYETHVGANKYIVTDDYVVSTDTKVIAHVFLQESIWRVPKETVSIGSYAALGNDNIHTLICHDSLLEIGECAFMDGALDEVHLPERMKYIGACAFESCDLAQIQLPEGLYCLSYAMLRYNQELMQVNIPSTVYYIMPWALGDATIDKEIILPEGLESIYPNSLRGAAKVHFPSTIKEIAEDFYFETQVESGIKKPFISVHPDNPYFRATRNGTLYKKSKRKPHLLNS